MRRETTVYEITVTDGDEQVVDRQILREHGGLISNLPYGFAPGQMPGATEDPEEALRGFASGRERA